jgi:hypothetical protein
MTYFNYDPYMNYTKVEYRDKFIRGPIPDFNKPFISYIGAAQTFGRFCEKPFPNLISDHLNIGGLNLGFGGAGPEERIFYKSIDDINKSKCCVIQVMSGRSCSNKLLKIKTGQFSILSLNREKMVVPNFWYNILKLNDIEFIKRIVLDTINTYTSYYEKLLSLIECPKILLLISSDNLKDKIDLNTDNYDIFIGRFPHFITNNTLNYLKSLCDYSVDIISKRGMPQKLKEPINKDYEKGLLMHSNKEIKECYYNNYYPSPEIHHQIKEGLSLIIKDII